MCHLATITLLRGFEEKKYSNVSVVQPYFSVRVIYSKPRGVVLRGAHFILLNIFPNVKGNMRVIYSTSPVVPHRLPASLDYLLFYSHQQLCHYQKYGANQGSVPETSYSIRLLTALRSDGLILRAASGESTANTAISCPSFNMCHGFSH